ncbi:hypothetical protein [Mycobacterium sp. IDR2000157661]|uniref:hypothetical protein n=1 Tax=Mycobacterium sp. IDR2000157661 TaxID=2867005 RepID=UPI001EEBE078|nr:hypothetical protein [Mycobacterium sp. IDR2000157661]ULE34001.1 hypothetical protein K3G64_04760 [Mycobacterium sp. IDR2000157661]
MTVTVTLRDGTTDNYRRFGDAYLEHNDGTLDVLRGGSNEPHRYEAGEWTGVEGDQKGGQKGRFWQR